MYAIVVRMSFNEHGSAGEAKIWIEPEVEIARNWGLDKRKLRHAVKIVRQREDEIREAWKSHFGN